MKKNSRTQILQTRGGEGVMACARNLLALIVLELMSGQFVGFKITVKNFKQFALV